MLYRRGDEWIWHNFVGINLYFYNLRGDQDPQVGLSTKIARILRYYRRLIIYAARSKATIFHILWNNKFEAFDRTLLTLYYKLWKNKRIVLTIHNVNAGRRDSNDTWLNRLTIRCQYRLADHAFVHTESMKAELVADFGVIGDRITVIPFGINNSVPKTGITSDEAKKRLGVEPNHKAILFFWEHCRVLKGSNI